MRGTTLLVLGCVIALAACGRGGDKDGADGNRSAASAGKGKIAGITPMAERVAVLGVLNKRNGITKDVALRPGQSARWKDLLVHLRACEASAPWEEEKLTGAFVQVDVQRSDQNWGRVFSGWLYKESPSLNVVEHPVYDVWPKSCAMSFPAGPAAPAAPTSSNRTSSAPKSGGGNDSATSPPAAATPAEPVPSAVASNST